MLSSLKLRLRPGLPYDGPACYVDGNGDGDPRHGYYALNADGKSLRRPLVRLTAVTHEDGSHHYEVTRKSGPHQRPYAGTIVPPARAVELAFEGEGAAEVAGALPAEQEREQLRELSRQYDLDPALIAQAQDDSGAMRAYLSSTACDFDEQTKAALRELLGDE